MKSIMDMQHAFKTPFAGNVENARWNPEILTRIWNNLRPIRKMAKMRRSRRHRKQSAGASYSLMGAPLDYAMVPGSAMTTNPAVAVYDRFPVDPTVSPQMVSDLDVYFGSALTRGCGVENSSLVVPADMGSNQVGGKRKSRRGSRKYGGADVGVPNFLSKLGDAGSSVANHPYLATPYPNIPQSATNAWQGKLESIPTSSDPTDHTWQYQTGQTPGAIPGNYASTIPSNIQNLYKTWAPTPANIPPPPQRAGARRRRTLRRKSRTSKRTRRH